MREEKMLLFWVFFVSITLLLLIRIPVMTSFSPSSQAVVHHYHYSDHQNQYQHQHPSFTRIISPSPSLLSHTSSTTTKLESAKILPIAYAGASGALLSKAVIIKATTTSTPSECLVLLAVSLLSLINFSISDDARLQSAQIAYHQKTNPASSGKEKQVRQAAITFRKAVRIKIIGQFVGLVRMILARSAVGVMRGGAIIMVAQLLYFFAGGGRSNHDNDGNWKPLREQAVISVLLMNVILVGAAILAANASAAAAAAATVSLSASTTTIIDSTTTTTIKFAVASRIYAFGIIIGCIEGLPQFMKIFNRK